MDYYLNCRDIYSLSAEEKEKRENGIRSNLRYSWQKTISFIIYYSPSLRDIEEQMVENFMTFIPMNFPKRDSVIKRLQEVFTVMLNSLLKAKDITNADLESNFINLAIEKFQGILL